MRLYLKHVPVNEKLKKYIEHSHVDDPQGVQLSVDLFAVISFHWEVDCVVCTF